METVANVPELTQLVSGGAGTQSRQSGPGVHVLSQLPGGPPLSCLSTLYLVCPVSAQDSPSLDRQLLWP